MYKTLVLFVIIYAVYGTKFPTDIEKCKFDDEECYIRVSNEILKRGNKGYAELGLPVFDPLFINKIGIDQGGNGPVVLKLDMKNVSIYGFSSAKLKSIKGLGRNIEKAKIEIKYSQPVFQIIGRYQANGKVLVLPVHGNGNSNITLVGNDCHLKILTKKIEKNGKTYMEIDKIKFNFDLKNATLEFENLFNGNKELSDTFNLFLSENWYEVISEIKPAMSESIASIFKSILNNLFLNIPYNELFSE